MVFIYHFLSSPGTQKLTSKADSFLKEIEKGKYIGIISTFTVAEYTGVIKEVLCNKRDGQVSVNEIHTVKAQFEEFITQMGIVLYDADSLATKIAVFGEGENVVEGSTAFKGRDGKWHSIKGADALHVVFALSVNAEAIATFDDNFRGANGFISPIMLSEVY